jgi:hypothetical protein
MSTPGDLMDSLFETESLVNGVPVQTPSEEPSAEPATGAEPAENVTREGAPADTPEPGAEPSSPAKLDKRTREGRKLSIQQEIDELTRQKYDVKRELEELQQARAQAARPPAEGTQEPPRTTSAEWKRYVNDAAAPKLDEFSDEDDPYASWNAAMAYFIADRRYEERHQVESMQQAAQTRDQEFQTRLLEARERIPNFDERIKYEALRPFSDQLAERIMASPVGPELVLYFSEHPSDAQRISTLHPIIAIEEMGILQGVIKARQDAAHSGSATAAVTSQAKPPIKPVGSSPVAADPLEITDDLPVEEHIRRMNLRERQGRR